MLAQVIRTVTYVPAEYLGTMNDIAHKLQGEGAGDLQTRLNLILREPVASSAETVDLSKIPSEFQPSAKLYLKLFGKMPDFSGLVMPQAEDGGNHIVVVIAKEIVEWTNNPKEGLFQARKKLFPTWKYDNDSLDFLIPMDHDQRDLRKGSYIVLMRDSETPDSDLMNLSANQIAEMNVKTSTDTEYALFSGIFFLKHGHHPDRKTWTINSGSRYRDGSVPRGGWRGSESRVYWFNAAGHNPGLGSRRVLI